MADTAASPVRILVADDDERLRKLFGDTFRRAGYAVEEAEDGDAALDASLRACPDLLLADLVMPGLTGDQLARRIRERCPRTILVFMSGYTEDQLKELDIRQVVFLPKPISPREMIDVARKLLEGRASRGTDGRSGPLPAP